MKRLITSLLLAIIAPLTLWSEVATVTLGTEKQTIKGFGGMNLPEWVGDLTASQRETTFGVGENQLGFSILRIFVNDVKDNWSKALPTAQYATQKGITIFASPWNPPSTMTETFTLARDTSSPKRLKYDSYGLYAQHLIDYVNYMKTNSVNLYAISIQNEPDWGFDWTWWTTTEMYNFVKNNAGAIKTACPDVKIMAAESFGYSKDMTNPILNDATALANMDILGVHTYGVSNPTSYTLLKSKTGKEFWMTEVYHPNSDANSGEKWPEALDVSHHIHKCLVDAEMQAYVWWYIRRSYSPMNEDGTISKRGAAMAQFSRFIRPGYVRIDVPQNPATNIYVSAYKNGDDVVIVAINKNTAAVLQDFSIPGVKVPKWERYVTYASKNVAKEADISASTSFRATLYGSSVTTFVGKMEFWAPSLKTAIPENESFDLPLTYDTYEYVYNYKVDCSTAKAQMTGPAGTFDLTLQETGYSDTLTFKLPENTQLTSGDYTFRVYDLVSQQYTATTKENSFKYSIGVSSETGTGDTIFKDGLDGGGIVPKGWKISWKGGASIREQNTTGLASGPRLIDFPNGGDYNAGFYLRGEGGEGQLSYGSYDDSRLTLASGKYAVLFNFSIWKGSNIPLTFTVLNQAGTKIFEQQAITTTHSLGESAATAPTGSTLCRYEFEIPSSGNYILRWSIGDTGFDGIIIGNTRIIKTITKSTELKNLFAAALAAANETKTAVSSSLYDGSAKTTLQQTIQNYTDVTFTAPSVIQAATTALNTANQAMITYKATVDVTGLSQPSYDGTVKEVQYFTPQGHRISKPGKGINIVKTIYTDGYIEILKQELN
jgi:glucuronoarabinoxylan endo-1,4-beta-xylanase